MAHINIEFTLFSAFYSPLISYRPAGIRDVPVGDRGSNRSQVS
jgi:hypothetical protein